MNNSICGADCESCGFGKNNNCKGCAEQKDAEKQRQFALK